MAWGYVIQGKSPGMDWEDVSEPLDRDSAYQELEAKEEGEQDFPGDEQMRYRVRRVSCVMHEVE